MRPYQYNGPIAPKPPRTRQNLKPNERSFERKTNIARGEVRPTHRRARPCLWRRIGAVYGDAARSVERDVPGPAVAVLCLLPAPREPARLGAAPAEGEGVERGAGGVEDDEVPRAGPRDECVGVERRPGGDRWEAVEVCGGGDGVPVLEDVVGGREERE
jgi:hypothetical protein